ncbi:BamA/TamA family outer membrane protein [Aquimarina latercula]|uniref:translocation and assembly module lipoprotein TamL n=1 Tax=Aquimarina latercula TaxID=987 RepID=UPI0004278892|nr:BamA/TamA family outer membrane protein [Aquimarina latercula]
MTRKALLILFLFLILCSCSIQRFIPENETLYDGASFTITSEKKIKNLKKLEEELQGVLRPQPNTSKLGLLAHYKVEKGTAGFVYKFINKKIGEAPVYRSNVDINRTENLLLNRLENSGFFYSRVSSEVKKRNKKSSIHYGITLKEPYSLETYQLETDTLPIHKEIQKTFSETVIRKGQRFDLANLKIERERIDARLKARGYYNFNADFLIFELDTNQYKTKRFDLYVRLKNNVPQKALIPYKLDTVNVFPNYTIEKEKQKIDTIIQAVNFIQDTLFFKPKRLRPYILFKKGQVYDPKKFRGTSRRLSSIGTYKYVNVQFDEATKNTESDSLGLLNTNVYLSPLNKRALSAELQGNTKSNGFTGPSLTLNYTNRNLFKGGEILRISGKLGYETQIGGDFDTGLSSTQLGLTAELVFPRLIFPIKIAKQFEYAIPKTKISAGIEYLNRSKLYSLSSFNASFGYGWNANDYVYHTINPISTSFIRLSNSTPEFETILEENPFLKNSFEQQLISGLTYNFTYSELGHSSKINPLFFSSNIDLAGNTLSLLSSNVSENEKKTILGVEFAQYIKVDADARMNFKIGKQQSLVTRIYGGIGVAYGNSDILPFSKQFFAGGPYSIRAFRTRSIGPGTYNPESTDTGSFFDRSGDIRLEANVEYRFPLYSYLKGAFFFDAGNVWLLNENEALPGGKFSSNFIEELAMGAGFGLRVDIQSFVIRLDWAAPIHTPRIDNNQNYTFDVGNGILNFAIGYPF